ncbi:MAG: ABC transporter permease [Planctomycetes bacterium]|nr:ABC transporter permease [Planctomycetota bacterium]
MKNILLGVWLFRRFILSSVRAEFRGRFAASRLGGWWIILHPLAQAMIFAFVLSAVLSAKLPGINNRYAYALYLMAGMLAWSLFTEIIIRSLSIFIENAPLMKKMAFPRICLPCIACGSVLVGNICLLGAILVVFACLGHLPGITVLWLPLLMTLNIALAMGIGLILGVLNVFLRDIGQVVPVILQLGFWFTPIVYMRAIIPEQYRNWLALNPMDHVVGAYQQVLVFHATPPLRPLAILGLISLLLLAFALLLFRRASSEMVDAL